MDHSLSEVVPQGLHDERLDRVVAAVADLSRSAAKSLVNDGHVTVDGLPTLNGSVKVQAGQMLAIAMPSAEVYKMTPDPTVPFTVVFDDDHVIVVDKPAGVVVHPGAGQETATLANGLLARYPELAGVGEPHRPGIVHRLDRGTSGLLVVARTSDAYHGLVEQLSAHEPTRIYLALAWGHLESDAGRIDAPIGRSIRNPTRMTVSEQGKPAVTEYTVIQRFEHPVPTTLVRCRLETGRTHQIRVHLRAIGHPVVADRDYDGGRPGLDPGRPFLHAIELRFRHPVYGDELEFTVDLPPDLQASLDRCHS